jgi:hypothetical protein
MPPLESRRSDRVHYHAPVELLARVADSNMPSCVLARSLDLGAGGMQLCAPVQMKIGAQVTCRMTLDGQPASLPGRVAWMRESTSTRRDEGHDMGICFDPLENHESALLLQVVRRSHPGSRSIELHFEGLEQPLVAQAETTSAGLRIAANLPILARGTALSFQLDAEGPRFSARVGNAMLVEEDRSRRLLIDLEVVDSDNPRFRRHARYGYPEEIHAEERAQATAEAAPVAAAPIEATPVATVPVAAAPAKPRHDAAPATTRARGGAATAVLAAAFGAALMTWVVVRGEGRSDLRGEFVVRPRATAPRVATQDEPADSHPTPLPRGATKPRPAPLTVNHASADAVLEPTVPARTVTDSNLEPTAPQQAPEVVPEVVMEGVITRVRIPFQGTVDEMKARVWAMPHALAVDLPKGRTALAPGRYPIGKGEVSDLQINERRSTLLVRAKVSAPISHYEVRVAQGQLELELHMEPPAKAEDMQLISPPAFRKDEPH